MKTESNSEVNKLIDLTKRFVVFAQQLLDNGKITEEQYHKMTYNKVRFLNDVERKSIPK